MLLRRLFAFLLGGISTSDCLGKLFEVERYDSGDAFTLWSVDHDCGNFSGYPSEYPAHLTKDCNTTLGCCCNFGYTFDTITGKCETLYDENSKGNCMSAGN